MSDRIVEHPVNCDGGWISCWACNGEGIRPLYWEDDPVFEADCDECKGAGGRPCPGCHAEIFS